MPNRPAWRRPARALLILVAVLVTSFTATALASTLTVKVEDSFFSAKKVTISRGSTVKWSWHGALLHNVKVRSGPASFHSRTQVHGTFSHTFTARGTYKLYCSLHPDMTMTVVVH